jgi:biotin synthase
MRTNQQRILELFQSHILPQEDLTALLTTYTPEDLAYAQSLAQKLREVHYGNTVYIRGLIELTSYCRCDCHYCGIRAGNPTAERYRLTPEEVLACCSNGYALGFRTFVLQGGEDPYFTDEVLVPLIQEIRRRYPDCAITLSLGERPRSSYAALFEAGANRYLLRHETADEAHYRLLHPKGQELSQRIAHLEMLQELGYQIGTGFMVGSPGQTPETLAKDLLLLQKLDPEMVGIGPFVPHHASRFKDEPAGSVELTLFLLALIRIMLPKALIPATTSLATLDGLGREKGMASGANVVMPNLSPQEVRTKYLLYDNKAFTGSEAAESLAKLKTSMAAIGLAVVVHRGDPVDRLTYSIQVQSAKGSEKHV